jgi:hypothetical protein
MRKQSGGKNDLFICFSFVGSSFFWSSFFMMAVNLTSIKLFTYQLVLYAKSSCWYHGTWVPSVPSQVSGQRPGQSSGTCPRPGWAKGRVQCPLRVSPRQGPPLSAGFGACYVPSPFSSPAPSGIEVRCSHVVGTRMPLSLLGTQVSGTSAGAP